MNKLKKITHAAILLTLVFLPTLAFAQETAQAAGEAVTKKNFLQVLMQGGWSMILIALCSFAMVSLTIEIWMRTSRKRVLPDQDRDMAQRAFRAGDYLGAYQAMKASGSPYASVVRAGLASIGFGKEATEEALVAEVDKVNSTLQTRINYLSVIGVCTPMIGLLGTVGGMMGAFSTLGTSGIGDSSKLAGHIGEVLVATASGLFIAIPAFMSFYFLRNRLQGAMHRLEEEVSRLFRNAPYEHLREADVGQEETYAAMPNWVDAPAA